MGRSRLYKGAFTLAWAGFLTKLIGALYRIPLARLLGAEGMGLYQMAYPVYTVLLALSAAGMPIAMSILVAEKITLGDGKSIRRIFRLGIGLMACLGLIFSFIIYQGASFAAIHILHEPRAFYSILAIAPAVIFSSLTAVFRGYFQGFQEMGPTATSQIIEQLIRVTTVLVLVYYLLPKGLDLAAAGAAFGAVTGGIASLVYLIYAFRNFGKKNPIHNYIPNQIATTGNRSLGRRLLGIALPLSLGGIVLPLMQVVDASIVPFRLQIAGYSVSQATEHFGQLAGMASTLINLPAIVSVALATSLVPAVYEAYIARNQELVRIRIRKALKGTMILMVPAAAGLWVLATPISVLLYDLAEAGKPLAVLAPGALFFGLYQVSAGAIQGMGKTYLPVLHLLVGVLLKTYLSYWLVTWPFLGIQGAALATVIGFSAAFYLNYRVIKRILDFNFKKEMKSIFPIGLAAFFMVSVVYWLYEAMSPFLGNNLTTLLAVAVGAIVYGGGLIITGAVKAVDLEQWLGGVQGGRLVQILIKFRLVK